MNRILPLAAIPFIAITLAGCPAIDKLSDPDKPSEFQQSVERRAALTLPEPEPVNLADAVAPAVEPEPEPVIQPVLFVQPMEPAPQPCNPVFRISYCDENGNEVMF